MGRRHEPGQWRQGTHRLDHPRSQGHIFKFPTSFKLKPGKSVKVHTGKGTDTNKDLYWKQDGYVWNNEGDKAILKNKSKAVVDTCKWASGGGSTTC